MSSPKPRRRWLVLSSAAVVALLIVAGAAVFFLVRKPGDVSNPDVAFSTTETPPTEPAQPPRKALAVDTFSWPTYGLDDARTRDWSTAPDYLRPRFRRGWTYRGTALIEFPPVISGATIFMLDDDGWLRAIDKTNGSIRWHVRFGRLAASSPTLGDGNVYVTALESVHGSGGRVGAYRQLDGKPLWTRDLPSRAESSPLVHGGLVIFGSEDGTVYALDARTGQTRWTYKANGAVKGAPAYNNGNVYFGDYGGKMHALRASDGKVVWSVGTSGTRFGFGSGQFYSTPAVAFGRVYIGNTDSRVYSFSARDGALAWATSTGGYVYSAPSVADVRGLGPTVYIGSYDGSFYAFDARSGTKRWSYRVGQRISGSSTVIGGIVYFSNLGTNLTHGLNTRTGRQVFQFPEGSFTPAIADRRALYLTGYANFFELLPAKATPAWRRANAAAVRASDKENDAIRALRTKAAAATARAHRAHRAARRARRAKRGAAHRARHAARRAGHAARKARHAVHRARRAAAARRAARQKRSS
ncbi:MAG TPA: PQQ-binding-like beta-propeller repeat protein [Conexibacter sp.]